MKGKKKSIRGDEWIEEQGLILFRGKVYVPRDEELRKEITRLHHNTSISGHLGCWKMLELVMRNYWWPGISKYVLSHVNGEFSYNNKIQKSIKISPFYANYGFNP